MLAESALTTETQERSNLSGLLIEANRKYLQQNYRRKFPKPKERDTHEHTRSLQNSNRLDQKRNSYRHIIIRIANVLNKDRILKAVREKGHVTYKDRPIRTTPDFSPETMKSRRSWTDIIQTLREHKFQSRLLYPAKLSITIDGETKVFHDKTKFTQ